MKAGRGGGACDHGKDREGEVPRSDLIRTTIKQHYAGKEGWKGIDRSCEGVGEEEGERFA